MSIPEFEALRKELTSLRSRVASWPLKTVRDRDLLGRFQDMFRAWSTNVKPGLEPLTSNPASLLRLDRDLKTLATLSTRFSPTQKFRDRLRLADQAAASVILSLPHSPRLASSTFPKYDSALFTEQISDLPSAQVPRQLVGYKPAMEKFLDKHPFDRSIFLIVRYEPANDPLLKRIKSVLAKASFEGILAKDHRLTDDLYNPIACLFCCSKAIAIFDRPIPKAHINPNVAYELGMVHLLARECLILKHTKLKTMPSDILMKLYTKYTGLADASKEVKLWIEGFDKS